MGLGEGRLAAMAYLSGRALLRDYRLRVATVLRDYGMTEWAEAPADSRQTNG